MTTTCPRAGGRPSSVATTGAAVGVGLAVGDEDDTDGVGAASCLPPPEHAADNTTAAMVTTVADVAFRVTVRGVTVPGVTVIANVAVRRAARSSTRCGTRADPPRHQ